VENGEIPSPPGSWSEDVSDIDIDKLHGQEEKRTKTKPLLDPNKIKIKFVCDDVIKGRFLKIINSWNEYDQRTPLMPSGLHLGAMKDIVAFVTHSDKKYRPEIDTILVDVKLKKSHKRCGGKGFLGMVTTPQGVRKPLLCSCLKYDFSTEKGEEPDAI
jgi:hypothetical protein